MSIPFICSGRSVGFEVKDKGRVLVLKEALFHPETNCYHDIHLVHHGWTLMGIDLGGAGTWKGVTEDAVRQIQMTYGIALKTLNAKPGQLNIWSQATQTTFLTQKDPPLLGFGRRSRNISYPFGKEKNDLLLSKEDAALYGATAMTLHDAVNFGIWNAMRPNKRCNTNSHDSAPSSLDRKEQKNTITVDTRDLQKKIHPLGEPIATFPSIPIYRATRTPLEVGYDAASFKERKKRLVDHLDRSAPIPFRAFINQNEEGQIESALFRRMLDALRTLAKNPKTKNPDGKYMRRLLKHWFRAAYHYLDKNSEPGDGYDALLRHCLEETKNLKKARAKAKEFYWRREATLFWMTLISIFALEKIDIDLLHRSISQETSLNSLFFK